MFALHTCAVSEAGLRGLEGLFLVSVSRLGKVIHAVGPEFILQEGGWQAHSAML